MCRVERPPAPAAIEALGIRWHSRAMRSSLERARLKGKGVSVLWRLFLGTTEHVGNIQVALTVRARLVAQPG
jgi:hypothetical protein